MTSQDGPPSTDQVQPSPLAAKLGFPPHAFLTGFPMGMLAAATAFDIASQFTATPCSDFPRPAFWLIGLGLVAGVVSGFFGIVDLVRLPSNSAAYRAGTRHVVITDAALLLYGISLFLRRGSDYCASIELLPFAASLVGFTLLVVGIALGARLTYTHRIGAIGGEATHLSEPTGASADTPVGADHSDEA